MADLGLKAYRFSISWPRVLPSGAGAINAKGLDFYGSLVDELLCANITPFVTLYHWDLPSELQRVGGWVVRDMAYHFQDYAAVVADRLGDRVNYWITHNEPWVVAFLGNQLGMHAPGWQDMGAALQVAHHLLLSHGLAVPVLRERSTPEARVGITLNMSPIYPATASERDHEAARHYDGYYNRWFADPVFKGEYPNDMWALYDWLVPRMAPDDMRTIQQPIDFLGVNYYTRSVVRHAPDGALGVQQVRPEGEYTAMDWEVYPQGLTDLLLRLTRDYDTDLYITENGSAYEDVVSSDGRVHDPARVIYLRKHLAACHTAIQHGAPLKGYFAWSLMDNFEWAYGYTRRFGILYVDYETQRRAPKDTAMFYSRVIAANGLEG